MLIIVLKADKVAIGCIGQCGTVVRALVFPPLVEFVPCSPCFNFSAALVSSQLACLACPASWDSQQLLLNFLFCHDCVS